MIAALIVAFVAGHATPVTCDAQNRSGWYHPETRSVQLAPWVCGGLATREPWFVGQALVVTIHEGEHAAGVADEHEAQCRALALVGPIAGRFLRFGPARQAQTVAAARAYQAELAPPYGGAC